MNIEIYRTHDMGEIQALLLFKHELKETKKMTNGVVEFFFENIDNGATNLANQYRQGLLNGDLLTFSLLKHHVIALIKRCQG